MKGEAFEEWLAIFDVNTEKVWKKEREELRKASMLYHCLSLELKQIQSNLNKEIFQIKQQLVYVDDMKQNIIPSTPPKNKRKTYNIQKENTSPNINTKNSPKINSPKINSPKRSSPRINSQKNKTSLKSPKDKLSGITSLNSHLQLTAATPSLDFLMLEQSSDLLFDDSNNSFISLSNEPKTTEISSEDFIEDSDSSSPKLDRNRLSKIRKNLNNATSFSKMPSTSGKSLSGSKFSNPSKKISPKNQITSSPNKSNYTNLDINLKSPKEINKRPSYDSDTFVDCTPEIKSNAKRGKFNKMSMCSNKLRKTGWIQKPKKKQMSTLTQLFGSQRNTDVSSLMKPPVTFDDDITYVEGLSGVTPATQELQSLKTENNKPSTSKICQDAKHLSLDFIEDYNKFPERNKSEVNYAYKERVRGNEKKKLDGWECDNCKKFYEGLKLNPEEIKKLKNKCSKHRSKFAPQPETPAGFWDLNTMSTQY